ncbi:MAG: hypothetical protein WC709_07750 [Thermoleophilia bacterium]
MSLEAEGPGRCFVAKVQGENYSIDLRRMTPRRRLVLILHGLVGWTFTDIAGGVGCTRQAVTKSWVAAETDIREQVEEQKSRLERLAGRDIP